VFAPWQALRCLALPSGVGSQIDVGVTIAGQAVTITSAFSYYAPASMVIDWNGSQSDSNVDLAITGSHFGSYDSTDRVRLGNSACERTEYVSDSALLCRASHGTGAALTTVVTVAVQYRTTLGLFSYPLITVARIAECSNLRNLMLNNSDVKINRSDLFLNTTRCPASPDDNEPTHLLCSGFLIPYINCSLSSKTNLPSFGAVIMLNGQHFGQSDYSPKAGLRPWTNEINTEHTHRHPGIFSSAMATVWVSESSVAAKMGEGLSITFSNAMMAITVNWQVSQEDKHSNSSILVSYDFGKVSSIGLSNQPGGTHVALKTLFMSGAGTSDYSSRIQMYGTSCESSKWISDSIMSCNAATGVHIGGYDGNNGAVVLTVFHFSGVKTGIMSLTDSFSFDQAHVQAAMVDIVQPHAIVITHSSNVNAIVHISKWTSKTPGLFNSGNQRQQVRAGIVGLTYIKGSNFAYRDVTQAATVGSTACLSTQWFRDDVIICRATSGPHGRSNRILVTIAGPETFATTSEAMSFDLLILSTFEVRNFPTWDHLSITLHGYGFELNDATLSVDVSGSSCEITTWVSDTVITAKIARGLGQSRVIVISGGNNVGSLTDGLSFDGPSVVSDDTISGFLSNMPVSGGSSTKILGAQFGWNLCPASRVGGSTCEFTTWRSDTSLIAIGSRGYSSGLVPEIASHMMPSNVIRLSDRLQGFKSFAHQGQIVVTSGKLSGTVTQAFTFDSHTLGTIRNESAWVLDEPRAGVMGGFSSHEVKGSSFASFDMTPSLRIGETTAENTAWHSNSVLSVKSSSGVSYELSTLVTVALEIARASGSFTVYYFVFLTQISKCITYLQCYIILTVLYYTSNESRYVYH